MSGALYLGWRYLAYHRIKTVILVSAVTLMLFLPAATRLLVEDSAAALTARADRTPLVIGASGSALELVLSALYFHTDEPPAVAFRDYLELRDQGLGTAIPMNTRFQAQGAPVVGTSLDYFPFRNITLASGRMMGLLGEAVAGAAAAKRLELQPGSQIITSPETVFDIAGVYPLNLNITGVLAPSGTADDDALFVDYRTSWVIQGMGHGHEDLDDPAAAAGVLNRNDEVVTANAALRQFNEITVDNIADFHFHGSTDDFPLSSVLVAPPDDKSAALLRGRYQEREQGLQVLVPSAVLGELLQTVFAVQNYVILGLAVLSLATVAVIILVFMLSQQLRRGEFRTLRRMGASRSYIGLLVASEILFVFLTSAVLATAMTLLLRGYAMDIMQRLISF